MLNNKELIYGTGNPAKLASMRDALLPLGLTVLGLKDLDRPAPDVSEDGGDPLENAKLKALAYYNAFKRPVFSVDSGLYIQGLPAEKQPGVHVRNINGRRLTDAEMIAHYSGIAESMGGKVTAQYKNGVCLVLDSNAVFSYDGDELTSPPFYIVTKPHNTIMPGFPIDSLSVHRESGVYYYDRKQTEMLDKKWHEGFRDFFRKALCLPRSNQRPF